MARRLSKRCRPVSSSLYFNLLTFPLQKHTHKNLCCKDGESKSSTLLLPAHQFRQPEEEKMSLEKGNDLPESEYSSCLKTELTLGLPGGARAEAQKSGAKRGFSETVDLKLGTSSEDEVSVSTPPPSKAQVVGWPPVRSYRKNMMKNCKYVKVAVDGAPYLRKVDLEIYTSYQQLMDALEDMFTCLTICNVVNERKIMDPANGTEYVPTYEDRDGDWMLVGDVPWKMFVESCKRLRLMKSSEAIGLAPKTSSKGLSRS